MHEFSELLWGENKDGLVVDVSSLRRYLRGEPMRFDRYRQALQSLYLAGYLPQHVVVGEWRYVNELEAAQMTFLEKVRSMRLTIASTNGNPKGLRADAESGLGDETSAHRFALAKLLKLQKHVFFDSAFEIELQKIEESQQQRAAQTARNEALAKLVASR